MPIDFASVASKFAAAFAAQLRVGPAQRAIEAALTRRLEAARLVDRATEGFPIVRFYNGALSLWLPPGQRGTLAPATPQRSLLDHLGAGGLGFLDGLGRAIDPLRAGSQETAIARFATAANRALADLQASVRRFRVPTPAMFDPRARTAGDLAGLMALAFQVLAEAATTSGAVRRLAGQLRGTLAALGIAVPDRITRVLGPVAVDAPPVGRTLAETADALARETLGALVLVGSLPKLIEWLLTEGALALRKSVLDGFRRAEHHVYHLRGAVFEFAFGGGTRLAARGVALVGALGAVLGAHLEFQLKFYRAYGTGFAGGVREFVVELGLFLRDVLRLLRGIPVLLGAITAIGLGDLLRAKLGGWAVLVPALSLDDLLDDTGTAVDTGKRDELHDMLNAAQGAIDDLRRTVPGIDLLTDKLEYGERQIGRTRRLVDALFTSGGSGTALPIMAEAAPLNFRSEFPDLAETVFGGGRKQQLLDGVTRIEHAARLAGAKVFRRTFRNLNTLSDQFAGEAARAAKVDEKGRLAALGPQADALAEAFYGPEVDEQRRAVARHPQEALAKAFETWLATGGFLLVGEAIPAYVGHLAATYRAQLAQGSELTFELTPTSPHLLRKRALLGRVRMPRLTLRAAAGTPLDAALAEEIAEQFGGAVLAAYRTGHQRVRELATAGGGR
ncbi:hypothetical protein AB0H76_17915 [Nocardia sp. NPDC050712]|uniref:hypothetical protein n=1 Tax=Nocardia sp. NPDC050712 TaxID=3155518 RepID=UPI0033EC5C14